MTLLDHEIPTVFNTNSLASGIADISSSVVYYDTSSGTENIIVEVPIYHTENSSFDLLDTFLITNTISSGVLNTINDLITEDTRYLFIDTIIGLWLLNLNNEVENIDTDLFFYSSLRQQVKELINEFRINIGSIPTNRDTITELYLYSPKYLSFDTSVYCATSGTLFDIDVDIKQQKGRVVGISSEIYSTIENSVFIGSNIFCTDIDTNFIPIDFTLTSGTVSVLANDIYSTGLSILKGTEVDIKTRSIFVSDFFIDTDKFTTASSTGYVDIIDYLYPIVESSTYIQMDGITISGTYFKDIPYGKRLYFDPTYDFYSTGEIILNVYSESTIGEVIDEDFFLLYGYDIELNEVVSWKPNERVVVRGNASNLGFCPNEEGIAYYFDTREYESLNLPVSLNAITSVDLGVSIYPQSTAFFYGKTYSVKIEGVKDFSGNIMEPFIYTFTIENPEG